MKGNENQTVRQNQEELIHGSIIRSYTHSVVLIRAIKKKGRNDQLQDSHSLFDKNRAVVQNKSSFLRQQTNEVNPT